MNPMELSNVIRPDKEADHYEVATTISKVVWELATKNPLWRFKSLESSIAEIADWYRSHESWWRPLKAKK